MVTLDVNSNSHSIRKLEKGETVKSFNCGDAELNEIICKIA